MTAPPSPRRASATPAPSTTVSPAISTESPRRRTSCSSVGPGAVRKDSAACCFQPAHITRGATSAVCPEAVACGAPPARHSIVSQASRKVASHCAAAAAAIRAQLVLQQPSRSRYHHRKLALAARAAMLGPLMFGAYPHVHVYVEPLSEAYPSIQFMKDRGHSYIYRPWHSQRTCPRRCGVSPHLSLESRQIRCACVLITDCS
jgi:hypothetical protein